MRRQDPTVGRLSGGAARGARARSEASNHEDANQSQPSRSRLDPDRRRRRALFLRELAEARQLRERVHPRRTRNERMRQALRMRTFRT